MYVFVIADLFNEFESIQPSRRFFGLLLAYGGVEPFRSIYKIAAGIFPLDAGGVDAVVGAVLVAGHEDAFGALHPFGGGDPGFVGADFGHSKCVAQSCSAFWDQDLFCAA